MRFLELTLHGKTTTTAYVYSKDTDARSGAAVQHTVSTLIGFDDHRYDPNEPGRPEKRVSKSITLQHSLRTGYPLLNRDDNDMETAYAYDQLGRIIEEIVAPGTPNEAKRTYTYKLSHAKGIQAEQTVTDVKGVQTRTLFDGLNRVVHEEFKGSDPLDPDRVIRTYSARYNARGQLSTETTYDWWVLEEVLAERALTTRYHYDDWGQQHRVTGPDGVASITEIDPICVLRQRPHQLYRPYRA